METTKTLNWYVLFVHSGKEQVICDFLNLETSFHAFIILKECIHKKGRELIIVNRPLFPSYIFVETKMDRKEFQEVLKIKREQSKGIIKELKYDEDISSLLPQEKDYLVGLMDHMCIIKKSIGYIENDNIIIIKGPLKGYENNIIKIDRHKRQAILKINILGNLMRLKVPLEIIKKI